ncbi:Holliday junction branch migration protein RuvA, partial [Acinetobacter baumannii]|nr:Holliday junction branch migration protein RuvA [Acinetobacter baumannii]
MALPMLSGDNKDGILDAIESGNINYLKKFPKIGDKVARQIILDLKGKLEIDNTSNKKDLTELIETLKSL